MGRLAFAFYVVHFIVIRYVELTPLAQLAQSDGARWALIPLLLVLTLIGAVAIHFGFERRVEKYLQAKFSPAPPATS
jgi:peptidoglycan/LPS O-acetylase OafA/YrhL